MINMSQVFIVVIFVVVLVLFSSSSSSINKEFGMDRELHRIPYDHPDYVPPKVFVPPEKYTPRKSLSAFFWFSLDERAKVREEHPDWCEVNVAREIGRRWNALEDSARVPYKEKFAEDQKRYEKEVVEYEEYLQRKKNP